MRCWRKWSVDWQAGRGCTYKGGSTLLKSTLSNIPTYFLSLFPILVSMARRIEK